MKILSKATMALLAAAVTTVPAHGGDGVKVEHLGPTNTLVRVTGEGDYMLLPVQESNEDAAVNVIVDGRLERTVYVRMAKSKVDYTVPFDLRPYKGHEVVFDIVTSQSRSSVREAREDACWDGFSLTDTFDVANRERFRPAFHHTPAYGWMNDPNGMFWKDGEWHLYYQWNPYGSKWQNMTWGHSSSPDLVHWTLHPAAIEPNGLGTVFSGSCAVDTDGSAGFGKDAVVAMYTSAGVSQIQSLAWSDDGGMTFNTYPGNPVLTLESEARDPNMVWNPSTKQWTLVLAHALEHEMLIFTSPDMKEWTLQSSFGKGLGAQDGVWECPDLFELPVEGTGEKKWVLLCNLNPGGLHGGSATQYFTGTFDGKVFKPDTDADGNVPTKWLDYGKDHYATVSWSDAPASRRTAIGWMSNWQYAAEVPTMQFRSANTLPRELSLFRGDDGSIYVASAPSPELLALRGKTVAEARSLNIGAKTRNFSLPAANGGICEILVDLQARPGSKVTLTLSNPSGEKVDMVYDPSEGTLTFDRRESGMNDFSCDFPAVTSAPVLAKGDRLSLRVFVDRSSIEVFGDEGRFVMTNLVFPTVPYDTLSLSASGGHAKASGLKIFTINPVETI